MHAQVHPHMPMLAGGGTASTVRMWAPCGELPAAAGTAHGSLLTPNQRSLAAANVRDSEAQAVMGARGGPGGGPWGAGRWAPSLFREMVRGRSRTALHAMYIRIRLVGWVACVWAGGVVERECW